MCLFTGKKSIGEYTMKRLIVSICLLLASATGFTDNLDCPCKVVKVTDGDTIHVLDQQRHRYKVRLAAIDAPEKNQAYGHKSTQNLARMIAGQNVKVEYNKRDQYGRIVGKVLKNGQDINLAQVVEGYAWHYKYYQREQSKTDRALYSAAETEARAQHVGLWSMPATPPWEFRHTRKVQ
jgi:endonuclease YncB( thermonuclease family)